MSNSDILEQELKELETSLVFEDAIWDWTFNVDLALYDITMIKYPKKSIYRIAIPQDLIKDVASELVIGLAEYIVNVLYNAAKAGEDKKNEKSFNDEN